MKQFKNERQKISYSLIFSVCLHFGFLIFMVRVNNSENIISSNKKLLTNVKIPLSQFDSVKIISQKELQAIKDIQNKQIVANEARGLNERPTNSRFLGEKDQTFERQTIAKTNGSFKEAGLGNKDSSNTSLSQTDIANKKLVKAKPKTSKRALTLSDLNGFKMADVDKMEKESQDAINDMVKTMAAEGIERGKLGASGLAANNDFVEEIPLGDMTNLNTTEFKYYGFYHRIRQKLEQHWGSSIKDKAKNLYRSGRRMPASENLITSVTVTLNDHGQIVDMVIEGTSGIRELDQAAIESFNKAGPFPNPPKGLLVGGRATIQWGFVVKS